MICKQHIIFQVSDTSIYPKQGLNVGGSLPSWSHLVAGSDSERRLRCFGHGMPVQVRESGGYEFLVKHRGHGLHVI